MKVVFVSIALNIHQVHVSDELYRLTEGNYWFVETGSYAEKDNKGGEGEYASRPYLIHVGGCPDAERRAMQVIREADVMIYGAAPLVYLKERMRTGKLTFVYSERWLKRGWLNMLSPRLLRQWWFYHTHCHCKPIYALCASAYAARDFRKLGMYRNRCFKWGYFTHVPEIENQKNSVPLMRNASTARIVWVARFLQLKHPERMLQLASLLRREAVDFVIDMIGVGSEYDKIAAQIEELGLQDCVHQWGAVPNQEVLEAMRSHDIFCFTSDRNEGWGAVLNEAMSVGCCSVASREVGSAPYLIQDGVNGLLFDLNKPNDLFEKVLWLIRHPEERERMGEAARRTMQEQWNPRCAAERLYALSESMRNGFLFKYEKGPCSIA